MKQNVKSFLTIFLFALVPLLGGCANMHHSAPPSDAQVADAKAVPTDAQPAAESEMSCGEKGGHCGCHDKCHCKDCNHAKGAKGCGCEHCAHSKDCGCKDGKSCGDKMGCGCGHHDGHSCGDAKPACKDKECAHHHKAKKAAK